MQNLKYIEFRCCQRLTFTEKTRYNISKTMLELWVKRFEIDIDIGSKEFFKLAKMDMHDAHNYIIEKYGRNEANYYDKYMIPRYSNMKIAYEAEFR